MPLWSEMWHRKSSNLTLNLPMRKMRVILPKSRPLGQWQGHDWNPNRVLVQGPLYHPVLSPSALHTEALFTGWLWGPDASSDSILCCDILQGCCVGQVILILGTCSVKSKTLGYVHFCYYRWTNGPNRIWKAVSIGTWVRCAHYHDYLGSDGLGRGLAGALPRLSIGRWQVNLLRAGGTSPWDVSPGKGPQWVKEGWVLLIVLVTKIRTEKRKENWQVTLRWQGESLLLCFTRRSTITLTNFSLERSLLAFSVIYEAQDATWEESRFVALLRARPLALGLCWDLLYVFVRAGRLLSGACLRLDKLALTWNNPTLCCGDCKSHQGLREVRGECDMQLGRAPRWGRPLAESTVPGWVWVSGARWE